MTDVQAAPQTPDPGVYGPDGRSEWLDIDWREHQKWVQVAGRPVNVIDIGEGSAIVFIHGLAGAWVNWLENIPHFARDHRVIAMDLPGFGHSPMPAEKISIAGYGRIVDELLDALGIERAVVVGNSMGGFIGAELALAFPTRVSKLVLISAAGISAENMWREPVMAVGRLMAVGAARTGVRQMPVVNRPRLRRAALQLVIRYPEKLSVPLASELVVGAGSRGFVGGLDAVLGYSFRDRLPEIEIPTLIVWGRNDILIPVEDAYEFQRLIGSNARLEIFDDTGHLAMLERPSRFNGLLDGFIAE